MGHDRWSDLHSRLGRSLSNVRALPEMTSYGSSSPIVNPGSGKQVGITGPRPRQHPPVCWRAQHSRSLSSPPLVPTDGYSKLSLLCSGGWGSGNGVPGSRLKGKVTNEISPWRLSGLGKPQSVDKLEKTQRLLGNLNVTKVFSGSFNICPNLAVLIWEEAMDPTLRLCLVETNLGEIWACTFISELRFSDAAITTNPQLSVS